jgi:hypothetical protein
MFDDAMYSSPHLANIINPTGATFESLEAHESIKGDDGCIMSVDDAVRDGCVYRVYNKHRLVTITNITILSLPLLLAV